MPPKDSKPKAAKTKEAKTKETKPEDATSKPEPTTTAQEPKAETEPKTTDTSESTASSYIGWGNLLDKYKPKEGSWKCDGCMLVNDPELTKCRACERERERDGKPGTGSTATNTGSAESKPASAFVFGSAPALSSSAPSASATTGGLVFGSASSGFGSSIPTTTTTTPSATTGGLVFGSASSGFGSSIPTTTTTPPATTGGLVFGSTSSSFGFNATPAQSSGAISFGSTSSGFGATTTNTTITSNTTETVTVTETKAKASEEKPSEAKKTKSTRTKRKANDDGAEQTPKEAAPIVFEKANASIAARVALTPLTPKGIPCDVFTVGTNEIGQLGHGAQLSVANRPKKVLAISNQLKLKAYDGECGTLHTILFALPAEPANQTIPVVSSKFLNSVRALETGESVADSLAKARKTRGKKSGADAPEASSASDEPKKDDAGRSRWTLVSWGCNDDFALGRVEGDENIPGIVTLPAEILTGRISVVQVSCGDCHSALLTDTGAVYSWGSYRNAQGHIGYSADISHQKTPRLVEGGLKEQHIVQIASGGNHTLALTMDGQVFAWGDGQHGQLGRHMALRVKGGPKDYLTPKYNIEFPSAAMKSDEQEGEHDREGDHKAKKTRPALGRPMRKSVASPIVRIYAGAYHNMAIARNGAVFGWGLNNHGQLGLGHHESVNVPTRVASVEELKPVHMALGNYTSAWLSTTGEVFTAGRGDCGQLGSGDIREKTNPQLTPIRVKFAEFRYSETDVSPLNAGAPIDWVEYVHTRGDHFLAVTNKGNLYAWGAGDMSQLANASSEAESNDVMQEGRDAPVPIPIASRNRRIPLALGGSMHTVILASTAEVEKSE